MNGCVSSSITLSKKVKLLQTGSTLSQNKVNTERNDPTKTNCSVYFSKFGFVKNRAHETNNMSFLKIKKKIHHIVFTLTYLCTSSTIAKKKENKNDISIKF